MEHTLLNQNDIQKRIPHRFENLLLDTCKILEPGVGEGALHITENDPLNRQIFIWKPTPNTEALLTTISMEIMALLSIATTGAIKEGENAFFAAISNFKRQGYFNTKKSITSKARRASDKGGFLMYKGELITDTGSASGDVLAFYTDKNVDNSDDAKKVDVPSKTQSTAIPTPTSKTPSMFLCDNVVDKTDSSVTIEYTYPADHPLTKGHFPDRPIMMGVMQWLMLEDAAYAAAVAHGLTDNNILSGDATIIKSDGTLICDMKRVSIETWHNAGGHNDGAATLSAKRIAFRSMVSPLDTLYLKFDFSRE